jgi:ectoine hydroxylase-related dioxygenase (phytanoyl-CoA dioxygenase family)
MDLGHLLHYRRHGFAVVKGVFRPAEVAELAAAFDRVREEGLRHPKSYRHGNVLFRIGKDAELGRILRLVQWPSYFEPVLDRYRLDRRLQAILAPIIGTDLKQIINQLHWKPPGAAGAEFGWHQDIRFRRPRAAYRDPANSYVQTGIAIDRHRAENGAMIVIPGSHRLGELALGGGGRVMDTPLSDEELRRVGLDPATARPLELHLLHGSGPNRTADDRRFYLNGYVTARNCERGVVAFQDGAPHPLGPPVLVHYEELHARPEPHYLEE